MGNGDKGPIPYSVARGGINVKNRDGFIDELLNIFSGIHRL